MQNPLIPERERVKVADKSSIELLPKDPLFPYGDISFHLIEQGFGPHVLDLEKSTFYLNPDGTLTIQMDDVLEDDPTQCLSHTLEVDEWNYKIK